MSHADLDSKSLIRMIYLSWIGSKFDLVMGKLFDKRNERGREKREVWEW